MQSDLFAMLADDARRIFATANVYDVRTAPAIVRDSDPISSHHGADHIAPKRRSQRDTLLAVYQAYPHGLTDEEAGHIAGIGSAWKRCAELRKLGLIAPTGDLRTGSSGVKQQVCKVTP